jgi:hypothetical protein
MLRPRKNILVLVKHEFMQDKQLECLHDLLQSLETPEHFCNCHEMIDRDRIHSQPEKMLKESRHFFLRAFRFLINKN